MISISHHLQPFSHLPGSKCLIPKTSYVVQAFPTLLKIFSIEGKLLKEMSLEVEGPLRNFTLMQDLDRGCVSVYSEKYRYHVLPNLEVVFKKNPGVNFEKNEEFLFLGSSKKQEWEGMKKRGDYREIFPMWFRLGSLLQLPDFSNEKEGMFFLLEKCREAIQVHQPEKILPAFEKLFLAGFESLLVPRLQDDDYQGILNTEPFYDLSPLYLLQEGAKLIRSLFVSSHGSEIVILPNLPPEFFSGRMKYIQCKPFGSMDLEWTKKSIRKIVFRASKEGHLFFHLPPSIKSFRVRNSLRDKGKIHSAGDAIAIKTDKTYLLDLFKK